MKDFIRGWIHIAWLDIAESQWDILSSISSFVSRTASCWSIIFFWTLFLSSYRSRSNQPRWNSILMKCYWCSTEKNGVLIQITNTVVDQQIVRDNIFWPSLIQIHSSELSMNAALSSSLITCSHKETATVDDAFRVTTKKMWNKRIKFKVATMISYAREREKRICPSTQNNSVSSR